MKKSLVSYSNFIFKITSKKKSTIILPIVQFVISLILGIVLFTVKIEESYKNIFLYSYTLLILVMGVLYSSLKSLNIFKDLESEGIELLVFSKPISRKTIYWGKILCLFELGLIWSATSFLGGMLVYWNLVPSNDFAKIIFMAFFVQLLSYLFFGLVTTLISYKLNQKFSTTLPIMLFAPLAIGGTVIAANSTTRINNAAYYLNTKYDLHKSGNEIDAEKFYLNNNKDILYIMPNGLENKKFTKEQVAYLDKALEVAKNASSTWQKYSWLSIPYQMVDIFNLKNENVFSFENAKLMNLNNTVYYKKLDNTIYDYKVNKKPELLKLLVNTENGKLVQKYFVPGVLKDYSTISNQINSSVIYARENASDFEASFAEDNFSFASTNNLVGKIEWPYMQQILGSEAFNYYAKEFYEAINIKLTEKSSLQETLEAKAKVLAEISKELDNKNSFLYLIEDKDVLVFDKNAVKDKKLSSEVERKVYLGSALLYYLYFSDNNGLLLKSLFKSESDKNTYAPSQITLTIDGYKYFIGGYESYTTKTQVSTDKDTNQQKVIIRYELTPSNENYLFQATDDVYSIERSTQVINKNVYWLIWLAFIAMFVFINLHMYTRKDCR